MNSVPLGIIWNRIECKSLQSGWECKAELHQHIIVVGGRYCWEAMFDLSWKPLANPGEGINRLASSQCLCLVTGECITVLEQTSKLSTVKVNAFIILAGA